MTTVLPSLPLIGIDSDTLREFRLRVQLRELFLKSANTAWYFCFVLDNVPRENEVFSLASDEQGSL